MNRLILNKPVGERKPPLLSAIKTSQIVYLGIGALTSYLSISFSDLLVPYQLGILRGFGALSIFIAAAISLYLFWTFTKGSTRRARNAQIRSYLSFSLSLLTISLSILFYLQQNYVILDVVGNTRSKYLVGYKLSEQGQVWSQLAETKSTEELLRAVGSEYIPTMYGDSYAYTAVAYSVAYIVALFGLMLTAGGLIKRFESSEE